MARVQLRIGPRDGRPRNRSRLNWKRVFLALLVLAVVVLLLVMAFRAVFRTGRGPATAVTNAEEALLAAETEPAGPVLDEEKIVIPPGTSLADLLGRRNFDGREIHRLRLRGRPPRGPILSWTLAIRRRTSGVFGTGRSNRS